MRRIGQGKWPTQYEIFEHVTTGDHLQAIPIQNHDREDACARCHCNGRDEDGDENEEDDSMCSAAPDCSLDGVRFFFEWVGP